jgi:hypothetical protein
MFTSSGKGFSRSLRLFRSHQNLARRRSVRYLLVAHHPSTPESPSHYHITPSTHGRHHQNDQCSNTAERPSARYQAPFICIRGKPNGSQCSIYSRKVRHAHTEAHHTTTSLLVLSHGTSISTLTRDPYALPHAH